MTDQRTRTMTLSATNDKTRHSNSGSTCSYFEDPGQTGDATVWTRILLGLVSVILFFIGGLDDDDDWDGPESFDGETLH